MIKIYGEDNILIQADIEQIDSICNECKSNDMFCNEDSNINDEYMFCDILANKIKDINKNEKIN